ncbi:hypothetical protein [Nostoc sp. FACHB-110]|uniref:hypothetical protein n=1 Tax=Nostoc sp. FACHB-110 TaxID=2692834 RepID=UPI0016883D67|nr:hypothetical protein [Nostoc sp. FACHB-110]MBD2440757.1 hypothetical protein [Nostoc sp. FACHB-110]
MEFVILFLWLMLMLFILRLAYLVVQNSQQSSTQKHRTKHIRTFPITLPPRGRKTNSQQWRELLRLVHGDVATANRLVDYEMKRNPGRNFDWCVDKALWQLKRDRR